MLHPRRVAAVLALTLAGTAGACGDDPEKDVRATLAAFTKATAQKDYQRLCDQIFAEKLVEQVRKTVPCEVALQNSSLDDAKDPKLVVKSVKVQGDTATAVIDSSASNQPSSRDTVRLVKEHGTWRIASLAS